MCTWDLQWWHVESSFQAGARTLTPCTGNAESSPLGHQGCLWALCYYYFLNFVWGLWPIYAALFYFIFWLCWVFLAARGFSCPVGLWDQTHPCPLHWKSDASPLDHRGSPSVLFLNIIAY